MPILEYKHRYRWVSQSGSRRVVHGEMQGSLLFIPHQLAVELVACHQALRTAGTWGELKAAVHTYRRGDLEEVLVGNYQHVRDEAQITNDFVTSRCWPENPMHEMHEWLPKSVLRLGQKNEPRYGKAFVQFEPSKEAKVLAALQKEGYSCVKCQDLIDRACGF